MDTGPLLLTSIQLLLDYNNDKAADSNDRPANLALTLKLFHYCSKTLQVVLNVARVQCFFLSRPNFCLDSDKVRILT